MKQSKTKSRRFLLTFSSALLLCSLFAGCAGQASSSDTVSEVDSSSSQETSTEESEYIAQNQALDFDSAKALYESWQAKDFGYADYNYYKAYGAYYVKKSNDTFYSLMPSMKSASTSRVLLLKDWQENALPTISRNSGDTLILFSDSNNLTSMPICSIIETGYTIPFSFSEFGASTPYAYNHIKKDFDSCAFSSYPFTLLFDGDALDGPYNIHNYTLDGLSYDEIWNLPNAISDDSTTCIVSLDKETSSHIEYYEGTDYAETDVIANYFYMVLDSMWHEFMGHGEYSPIPTDHTISLTKSGYAEIDISSLTPGYYAIPLPRRNMSHEIMYTLTPYVVFEVVD